jgi:transketolase
MLSDTSKTAAKVQQLINDNNKKGSNIEWVVAYTHYPIYCAGLASIDVGCNLNSYQTYLAQFIQYFNNYNVIILLFRLICIMEHMFICINTHILLI